MTAWQTIFEVSSSDAVQATMPLLAGGAVQRREPSEGRVSEEATRLLKETMEKANDLLASHFDTFSGIDFQEFVRTTLKAAGLYPKSIRRGADQGVDIEAYRDPLQLGPPRILVQVKHRQGAVSGPEMREFLGTMNHEGDVGLYISTGGFKSDAKAAASQRSVRIMGWEEFVQFFLEVYDKLENEFKAKVPLANIRMLKLSVENEEENS
jgi:restriction system protein